MGKIIVESAVFTAYAFGMYTFGFVMGRAVNKACSPSYDKTTL